MTITPDAFVFKSRLKIPVIKVRQEGVETTPTEEIEDLQGAVEDLAAICTRIATDSRGNAQVVLEVVWGAIDKVTTKVNRLNGQARYWKKVVGAFEELQEERRVKDVASGMEGIMRTVDELGTRYAKLSSKLDEVEADTIKNLKLVNGKTNRLLRNVVAPTPAPIASHTGGTAASAGGGSVCVTTPIVDGHGIQVGLLGDVLTGIAYHTADNKKLRGELEALAADVTAQGGVVLGQHTFTSELQVLALCMIECPSGDAFLLFVATVSLFCHDTMHSPGTNWEKTTKAMEASGVMSIADRKVVASYDQHHAYWFTEGKAVVAGKVISAFATLDKWLGTGGMDGRRVEIETSADMAGDCVRTGIADKLPTSGKLAQLATRMLKHTQQWFQKVHKHLDSELTKLT
jgi:hypothetical protein